MQPLLCLCMIVKNEETCLQRCLQSVAGIVDEMVIVDTGSTDGTIAIAQRFGAGVFTHAWQGDFSLARNTALEKATGKWILSLDADEELDRASATGLLSLLSTTAAGGLRLRLRNLLPDTELCSYDECRLTRLYRNNPVYRYEGTIHEQIKPSIQRSGGIIEDVDTLLIHHGYAQRTAQGTMVRAIRNLELLASALERTPTDAYLHYQLGITYKSLGKNQIAENHLREVLNLDTKALDPQILETTHMKLGQLALARNDHIAAIDQSQRSLTYNPHNAIAHFVLAISAMYSGKVGLAYEHFVKTRDLPAGNLKATGDLHAMISHCEKTLGIKGSKAR